MKLCVSDTIEIYQGATGREREREKKNYTKNTVQSCYARCHTVIVHFWNLNEINIFRSGLFYFSTQCTDPFLPFVHRTDYHVKHRHSELLRRDREKKLIFNEQNYSNQSDGTMVRRSKYHSPRKITIKDLEQSLSIQFMDAHDIYVYYA